MTRTGIAYSQVELIAERLLQQGELPTIEKIRFNLGTGSNTTISRHLAEWKQHRLRASADILPPLTTPSDPVNEAVKKVWQQLQQDTEAKLQEMQAAADLRINEILQQLQVLEVEKADIATDNADLRTVLQEERQQRGEREREAIHLRRELAMLNERAEQLQQQLTRTIERYEQHIAQLTQQYSEQNQQYENRLQAEMAAYQQTLDKLQESAENQRHEHIAKIDALMTESKKLAEQNVKLQSQIEQQVNLNMQNEATTKQLLQDKTLLLRFNEEYLEYLKNTVKDLPTSESLIKQSDLMQNVLVVKFEKQFNQFIKEIDTQLTNKLTLHFEKVIEVEQ